MKRLITCAALLWYYDPKKELSIQCDASQSGLGAVLMLKGRSILCHMLLLLLSKTTQKFKMRTLQLHMAVKGSITMFMEEK